MFVVFACEMQTPKSTHVQFEKCELCQIHHRKKHRHVYSRVHQKNVQKCLSRFKKRIETSLLTINKPIIATIYNRDEVSTNLQEHEETNKLLMCSRLGIPDAEEAVLRLDGESGKTGQKPVNVWCYFCEKELPRDEITGELVIKYGLFWKHLQSSEHCKQRDVFWRKHRVDKYHKYKKEKFALSEDVIKRFNQAVEISLKQFIHEREVRLKREAERIQRQEMYRQRVLQEKESMVCLWKLETFIMQLHTDTHLTKKQVPWKPMNQSRGSIPLARVRTVAVEARGLTSIRIKDFDEKIGNIHTGALPPWLSQSDGSSETEQRTSSSPIGPTKEDHDKHLAAVKRGKLPPNRVGAKQHLAEMDTSSDWLPSFGRVWSKNPRTQVRKTFRANLGGGHTPSATITTQSAADDQQQNPPEMNHSGLTCEQQYLHGLNNGNAPVTTAYQQYNPTVAHTETYYRPQEQQNNEEYANNYFGAMPCNPEVHLTKGHDYGYVRRQRLVRQSDGFGRIAISDKLLE